MYICRWVYMCMSVRILIYMRVFMHRKTKINIIYKNCRQISSFAFSKIFIRWWPWVQAWFRGRRIITITQGAPTVSHNTTKLYWMVFNMYECHIRSDAVTALFWIFFYIFPLLCWFNSDFGWKCRGRVRNKTSTSNLKRKYVCWPVIYMYVPSYIYK